MLARKTGFRRKRRSGASNDSLVATRVKQVIDGCESSALALSNRLSTAHRDADQPLAKRRSADQPSTRRDLTETTGFNCDGTAKWLQNSFSPNTGLSVTHIKHTVDVGRSAVSASNGPESDDGYGKSSKDHHCKTDANELHADASRTPELRRSARKRKPRRKQLDNSLYSLKCKYLTLSHHSQRGPGPEAPYSESPANGGESEFDVEASDGFDSDDSVLATIDMNQSFCCGTLKQSRAVVQNSSVCASDSRTVIPDSSKRMSDFKTVIPDSSDSRTVMYDSSACASDSRTVIYDSSARVSTLGVSLSPKAITVPIEDSCRTAHSATWHCSTHCSTSDAARHCSTSDAATHCSTSDAATHCSTSDAASHCSTSDAATHYSTGLQTPRSILSVLGRVKKSMLRNASPSVNLAVDSPIPTMPTLAVDTPTSAAGAPTLAAGTPTPAVDARTPAVDARTPAAGTPRLRARLAAVSEARRLASSVGDHDVGPFYGLPSRVQQLFSSLRGIHQLYGAST